MFIFQLEQLQQAELSHFTPIGLKSHINIPRLLQQSITSLQSQRSQSRKTPLQQGTSVLQPQKFLPQEPNLPQRTDYLLTILPLETKRHIFSYLQGSEQTLIMLRRTDSHFGQIIFTATIAAKSSTQMSATTSSLLISSPTTTSSRSSFCQSTLPISRASTHAFRKIQRSKYS